MKANFCSLTYRITTLQEKGVSLESSLALVKKVSPDLKNVGGEVGKNVSKKIEYILDKNSGYKTLYRISQVLTSESFDSSCIEELIAADLVHFKYAPVVSADVEKSFS